jgi:NADPH-dependent curcumin reductase
VTIKGLNLVSWRGPNGTGQAHERHSLDRLNRKFELAARPVGLPKRTDWTFQEEPVRDPVDGEILTKIVYISLDPAMRGWMNESRSYIAPVAIGEVMRALALGRVVSSRNPKFEAGDYVYGPLGVQQFATTNGSGLSKVDPQAVPLPVYLSALGMPGLTAYFGLLDIGHPQPGETVVVSGAAGAVGSVVGQIAKIKGCRAVGIAGGRDKCRYISGLGFDAAIDYKSENVLHGLKQNCPKGVDIYFDNVGGEILEAALALLARFGRIAICGAISQYNNTTPIKGPSNYLSLLIHHGTMAGFVVTDYASRYREALRDLAEWVAAGKLKSREHIVEGIEKFPDALSMLFTGENHGKLILKVAEP